MSTPSIGGTDCLQDDSKERNVSTEPFDEGDVILRTADDVDFRVFRVVLSLASPFFKGLFSLQQPDPTAPNDVPVIPVTEDSTTLTCLLRYCYPIRNPDIDNLDLLSRVLEAAIKYDMDEPTYLAKEVFLTLMEDDPLHAYAISCNLRCEEEAATAAELWKESRDSWDDDLEDFSETLSALSFVSEMGEVSAGCYYRLLCFLRGEQVKWFCVPVGEGDWSNDSSGNVGTEDTDGEDGDSGNVDDGASSEEEPDEETETNESPVHAPSGADQAHDSVE